MSNSELVNRSRIATTRGSRVSVGRRIYSQYIFDPQGGELIFRSPKNRTDVLPSLLPSSWHQVGLPVPGSTFETMPVQSGLTYTNLN
jgi:hypothetical protein